MKRPTQPQIPPVGEHANLTKSSRKADAVMVAAPKIYT